MAIGGKIRQLRDKRGLSAQELAEKSGLGLDDVTAIEAGELSPPLGQIVALANALRVNLGDLLGDEAAAPYCIVRSEQGRPVSRFGKERDTAGGYSYTALGLGKQNRHMEPFLVTLEPGKGGKKTNEHGGEEMLLVLEGEVEVSLSGHTDILKPGDFIYYDSTLPHLVACHGDKPATLFAVIYSSQDVIL
ncbi:MAG: XRE family transcriptional regulator [Geothermobacteraceae bacterium]